MSSIKIQWTVVLNKSKLLVKLGFPLRGCFKSHILHNTKRKKEKMLKYMAYLRISTNNLSILPSSTITYAN